MIRQRRTGAPLAISIAIHAVVLAAILNAAFHYDFSSLYAPRTPAPPLERLVYVTVAPGGGAVGGTGSGAAPRAVRGVRPLVAPPRVPNGVPAAIPVAVPTGTAGGVAGGTGTGGGRTAVTGIVPGTRDPRLEADEREFIPLPKTHAQRVDSAVKASIYAFNDSVARASGGSRDPRDWTFEKNGKKWGVDGSKIYLGKFAIPSAVLAALPIRIQANPGEGLSDRLSSTRRADIQVHAASAFHNDEFKSAVKRIRERKDRERREAQQANGGSGGSAGSATP